MGAVEMRKDMRACTETHAPECNASCPVHVDVRGMLSAMAQGDYADKMAEYHKKVLLAHLVSHFCKAPCENRCVLEKKEKTVSIRLLEESACLHHDFKKLSLTPFLNLSKKVCVIGAGASGLAAAYFLYEKGYELVVFEKESMRLSRFACQEPDLVKKDLELLDEMDIEVRYNTRVGVDLSIDELCQAYDAVYVSGDDTLTNAYTWDETTLQTKENPKVFVGGNILVDNEYSIIHSIASGRRSALSIDRHLKSVSLTQGRELEGPYRTQLFSYVDEKLVLQEKVDATEQNFLRKNPTFCFSKTQLTQEAKRCLQCRCLQCEKQCVYMQHFKSYPYALILEMATHIRMIGGQRQGGVAINSCSMCGLCKEICPNHIEMPKATLSARQVLVGKEQNVAALHDFPMRDMQFSNGEAFSLFENAKDKEQSRYLFFPGCQLSAVLPELVQESYEYLLEKLGDEVGIYLGCCGAPAYWAGYEDIFKVAMKDFLDKWEKMGRPLIVNACSTCQKFLKQVDETIPMISLWEVFDEHGLPNRAQIQDKTFSIQDACTARENEKIHMAVRSLLTKMGHSIEELEYSRRKTKCCNYGGLVSYANPTLTKEVLQQRAKESDYDYVVYCGACKEQFQRVEKPSYHILELIFGKISPNFCDVSQKRENRIALKIQMQKLLKKEGDFHQEKRLALYMSEEIRKRLDERLILICDLEEAILFAEKEKYKLMNPESKHFITHRKKGHLTYWVEYGQKDNGFEIFNAYSHRVELLEK